MVDWLRHGLRNAHECVDAVCRSLITAEPVMFRGMLQRRYCRHNRGLVTADSHLDQHTDQPTNSTAARSSQTRLRPRPASAVY